MGCWERFAHIFLPELYVCTDQAGAVIMLLAWMSLQLCMQIGLVFSFESSFSLDLPPRGFDFDPADCVGGC